VFLSDSGAICGADLRLPGGLDQETPEMPRITFYGDRQSRRKRHARRRAVSSLRRKIHRAVAFPAMAPAKIIAAIFV